MNTEGSSVNAQGSSAYVHSFGVAAFVATSLGLFLFFGFGIRVVHADFIVLPKPWMRVAHSGIIVDDSTTSTVRGADLDSVNGDWTISILNPFSSQPVGAHDFYSIFRGSFGNIDGGVPVASVNYSIVDQSISPAVNSTSTVSFSIAPLGDPSTPSGTYTIVAGEYPDNIDIYDPATDSDSYRKATDADLARWFADPYDANIDFNVGYISQLQFNYVAGTAKKHICASCAPNILFIPGIEGSRLYEKTFGTEVQLWEPWLGSFQQDASALDLNQNGASINSVYTKAGATIDQVGAPFYQTGIYRSFLAQLAGLKASSTIADYLSFPYDWRQSPEDIVSNGTPYNDGTHFIDQALIALASTSKTGKVTIVAHSNGGLVAKALMIKLQQEGKANLVDKVILVDVPQEGTPMAIASMLHGDYDPVFGFIISQSNMRGLAQNMPDAYDLLPSSAYFARVASPVVDLTLDPDLKNGSGVPNFITSASDLAKFLSSGRSKPASSDIETPNVLSSSLLTQAASLHADLDNWTPPAGVQVIQIAGWGLDTPSGVTYQEENISSCQAYSCTVSTTTRHAMNITEDGDNTVVIPSQVATSSWPIYYIALNLYNKDVNGKFGHSNITETKPFQDLFSLLVASTVPSVLPSYVTTNEPNPTSLSRSIRLRVLSPVTLDAYDSLGNHTGMLPNPNPQSDDLYVQEQIPNSYYRQYGEGQYIGLPGDGNYKVVMDGTGTGTFTFQITPVSQGVAQTPITFSGVPVTASSTATVQLSASNPASTTLMVDENGDGKNDITIASSTQTADPLSYTKLIGTTILGMDMGPLVKIRLEAKFINVGYLIARDTKWDADDDDTKETSNDRLKDKIIRKLNRIETYIENENAKPVPKKPPQVEKISSAQVSQLIDMIEELKKILN